MNFITLATNQDLQWLYILLISIGSGLIIFAISFLITYLLALKKKKKLTSNAKTFYKQIVDVLGGIENINDVNVNSSRLSIMLNNNEVLNSYDFKQFVTNNNIGTVKTSKKITLVIGEYANDYYNEIKKLLEK